jgi:chromate transporter
VPQVHPDGEQPLATAPSDERGSPLEVLRVFGRLGLTSFGGPIAHLGYFHDEIVTRRRWLDEGRYAEIVALCQLLPGPASSQVGITLGLLRAGVPGALLAWTGFTLPSVVVMTLFAYGVTEFSGLADSGAVDGLKLAAVAVVAQAVVTMAGRLATDLPRRLMAVLAALALLAWTSPVAQVVVIAAAGAVGWRWLKAPPPGGGSRLTVPLSRGASVVALALFFGLLGGLPLLSAVVDTQPVEGFERFYLAGALVFGGGHVVLPLLQAAVVPPGWVTESQFLAGYGMAQAVPGPLFTFAAYLGAVQAGTPSGVLGALWATVAIFLSSFLIIFGSLPHWATLRERRGIRAAVAGVNAAVVGLLAAALYDPVWTSAVHDPLDAATALTGFVLLAWRRWPPWAVVVLAAGSGLLRAAVG